MSIQLPTQSRLQVAKVGFVTGDLPFREVLSVVDGRWRSRDWCRASTPAAAVRAVAASLKLATVMYVGYLSSRRGLIGLLRAKQPYCNDEQNVRPKQYKKSRGAPKKGCAGVTKRWEKRAN